MTLHNALMQPKIIAAIIRAIKKKKIIRCIPKGLAILLPCTDLHAKYRDAERVIRVKCVNK